jgi:hypothetical protein
MDNVLRQFSIEGEAFMGELSRIGVSIDSELLHRFDSFIADQDTITAQKHFAI